MVFKIFILLACLALTYGSSLPFGSKFGYDIQGPYGSNSREESRDGQGNVQGAYSLSEADGRRRNVQYFADSFGFRANVDTNEPGTASHNPADVTVSSTASRFQHSIDHPNSVGGLPPTSGQIVEQSYQHHQEHQQQHQQNFISSHNQIAPGQAIEQNHQKNVIETQVPAGQIVEKSYQHHQQHREQQNFVTPQISENNGEVVEQTYQHHKENNHFQHQQQQQQHFISPQTPNGQFIEKSYQTQTYHQPQQQFITSQIDTPRAQIVEQTYQHHQTPTEQTFYPGQATYSAFPYENSARFFSQNNGQYFTHGPAQNFPAYQAYSSYSHGSPNFIQESSFEANRNNGIKTAPAGFSAYASPRYFAQNLLEGKISQEKFIQSYPQTDDYRQYQQTKEL